MQHLSAMDAAFLQLETAETPMHLGTVLRLQLPPGYAGDFPAALARHVASRLHLAPMLNRRLVTMPFDLANPVWIPDDDVEIDYHLRRIKLPSPGNIDQLFAAVGRLHSIVMDRTRPLWELVLIEGIDGDGYALYMKVHHAGVDGLSGQVMLDALFDTTPEPRVVPPPPPRRRSEPAGVAELFAASVKHSFEQSMRLMLNMPQSMEVAARMGEMARDLVAPAEASAASAGFRESGTPRLSFNTTVSNQRLYAAWSAPLAEVKAIARACGCTLNDMVLAIASGALRRYLIRHSELPSRSLVAMMPMSLREAGDKEMTNRVTVAPCDLHTQLDDALDRLFAINASTKVLKRNLADTRKGMPSDLPSFGMPWLISGMSLLAGKLRLADAMPQAGNVVISNVPASPVPLYLAGARVTTYWPMLILTHGQGLGIAVQTYADAMEWGVLGCRRAIPDVADLVGDLAASLRELQAALATPEGQARAAATKAERDAQGAPPESPAGPRRRPTRSAAAPAKPIPKRGRAKRAAVPAPKNGRKPRSP